MAAVLGAIAAPVKLPDVEIGLQDVHSAKSASGSVHLNTDEIVFFLSYLRVFLRGVLLKKDRSHLLYFLDSTQLKLTVDDCIQGSSTYGAYVVTVLFIALGSLDVKTSIAKDYFLSV